MKAPGRPSEAVLTYRKTKVARWNLCAPGGL